MKTRNKQMKKAGSQKYAAQAAYFWSILGHRYNPLILLALKATIREFQKMYNAPDIYGYGRRINC